MSKEGKRKNSYQWCAGWPIIGRLWEVPSDAIVEARREVISATFYAGMPFWFLPTIGSLIFLQRPKIWEGLANGELFIYSAALIGPLAYIITKRHGRFKIPEEIDGDLEDRGLSYLFPYGQAITYFSSFLCIMSGLIFVIQRFRSLDQLKNVQIINETGLIWLSAFVAALSTFLLFCVTAYRNMLESLDRKHSDIISSSLKKVEDTTLNEWLGRKDD